MCLLKWFWGFWNWLTNLNKFKSKQLFKKKKQAWTQGRLLWLWVIYITAAHDPEAGWPERPQTRSQWCQVPLTRCRWACGVAQSPGETIWQFPIKLHVHSPYDPAIPLLEFTQDKWKPVSSQRLTCETAALFVIAPNWKEPKSPMRGHTKDGLSV